MHTVLPLVSLSYLGEISVLPLVSLLYLGEISVLPLVSYHTLVRYQSYHWSVIIPRWDISPTICQFIIPRWDISPTIGQFIIPRWDISPRTLNETHSDVLFNSFVQKSEKVECVYTCSPMMSAEHCRISSIMPFFLYSQLRPQDGQ